MCKGNLEKCRFLLARVHCAEGSASKEETPGDWITSFTLLRLQRLQICLTKFQQLSLKNKTVLFYGEIKAPLASET